MSKLHVVHRHCGGPALEDDDIHPDHPPAFLTEEDFSITCLTCLEEIDDPTDLLTTDILSQ